MAVNQLISVHEFCVYSRVDITFVEQLQQQGLIATTTIGQTAYVPFEQLPRLEKFVRLHQDLAIHPDDLDVVSDLLDRVEQLQVELMQVRNRLAFYEP